MEEINWGIPSISGDPIELTLKNGSQLFIVGPNGSGKSALIQRFVTEKGGKKVKWITAHRRTWFDSGGISVTPQQRHEYEEQTPHFYSINDARLRDYRAQLDLSAILFDLVAKENIRARAITRYVDDDECTKARKISVESSSPLSQINELLDHGTLKVTIENSNDQSLLARHPQGEPFNIEEMSDGERSALIIAAHVITVEPGTVLLIDEPERHLHRSIIEPFLSALFACRREDCAFIISTHEIGLPVANPDAQVLMLRSCQWDGVKCVVWDADVLEPNAELPEDLKLAILGSRKKILFVEGQPGSADFSLYTVLFPELSVVSKGSCEEVQKAVLGWRGSQKIHPVHVEIFGLIDGDNRTAEDVEELAEKGVFALEVYSVEALYYCSDAIAAVAHRQADSFGCDANELIESAKQKAIEALKVEAEKTPERMASLRCERQIREQILSKIPDKQSIMDNSIQRICVSIDSPYFEELNRFNKLVEEEKLDQLIARYSLRKSRTFEIIATTLRCRDQKDYERMVLAQIQRDNQLVQALKRRIGPLSEVLDSVENPQIG